MLWRMKHKGGGEHPKFQCTSILVHIVFHVLGPIKKHMVKGGFLSLSTLLEFNLEFDHVLLRTLWEPSVSIFIVRVETGRFPSNIP